MYGYVCTYIMSLLSPQKLDPTYYLHLSPGRAVFLFFLFFFAFLAEWRFFLWGGGEGVFN